MAKKRQKKDIVKKMQEKVADEDRIKKRLTFKHWMIRTVLIGIILFSLVLTIEHLTGTTIFLHTIIAVTIVLLLGLLHEGLHYYKAVKLGYKPKWWRTTFRMGFTIEHDNINTWKQDRDKIGKIPYVFIIPISIVILIIGVYFNYLGIIVAGVGTLLLHAFTYRKEGREL